MNEIPCTIYDDGICGAEARQIVREPPDSRIYGQALAVFGLACCDSHAHELVRIGWRRDTDATARLAAERQREEEYAEIEVRDRELTEAERLGER